MGQTRWPSIFSSLDVIGSHKKQTKLKYFFQIEDFGFPVSREDAYYQFYKNAPVVECAMYMGSSEKWQIHVQW